MEFIFYFVSFVLSILLMLCQYWLQAFLFITREFYRNLIKTFSYTFKYLPITTVSLGALCIYTFVAEASNSVFNKNGLYVLWEKSLHIFMSEGNVELIISRLLDGLDTITHFFEQNSVLFFIFAIVFIAALIAVFTIVYILYSILIWHKILFILLVIDVVFLVFKRYDLINVINRTLLKRKNL